MYICSTPPEIEIKLGFILPLLSIALTPTEWGWQDSIYPDNSRWVRIGPIWIVYQRGMESD